ncbi:hypothetical protein [Puniceibacterium sp. IMCC21224]|uniref:hypothetical protein n=1 Tax=Puniceibacterium sp. IMCC21224 TaxID=1618204 RepID=UPI00065DA444|nr:hypothetical protein IMCC21224_1588 [Puniceibacterium sp. IMCC21224]
MILELKRQGLGVSAIARQTGLDRKAVKKYLERGLEAPVYGPREPGERLADGFRSYLAERLEAFPGLSARRLHREVRAMGVALPFNRLCLNLCGGTVAFSPATILDRLGRTWRA